MSLRLAVPALAGVALATALFTSGPALAQATVMKECGTQWQAAKAANQVPAGQTWNQFLAQCRTKLSAQPAAAPAATAPATNPLRPAATAPAAAVGNTVFPTAVSTKYSAQSAGKARQQTCLDQYNANKVSGTNGGLKWIQKGGGYYSECNKRLKGA